MDENGTKKKNTKKKNKHKSILYDHHTKYISQQRIKGTYMYL